MATQTPTTPAPEKKPRKPRADAGKKRGPKFEYYAVNGTTPCRIDYSKILDRRPLLVPCKPGEALDILGRGAARGPQGRMNTMVERTLKVVNGLRGDTIFTKTPHMAEALKPYATLSGDWHLEKRKIAAPSEGTEG
jgi:hypothetical protein